ncbi:hypothetical protein MJD09_06990 [bacterium]|nr:hypothetical protein [bacterium]
MLFQIPLHLNGEPSFTVIEHEEGQFLQDCERLSNAHRYFNGVLAWFQWVLERAPVGPFSHRHDPPYDDFYEMTSGDIPEYDGPTIIILYTVEKDTVKLWGLNVVA